MGFVTEQWRRYVPIKQAAEQVFLDAGLVMTSPLDFQMDNRDVSSTNVTEVIDFRTPERLCGRPGLVALASNAAITQAIYVGYLDQVADKLRAYTDRLTAHAELRGERRESPEQER